MSQLYREQILELYKHPLNKGMLEKATHSARELNPLCGDEFDIQLLIEDEKIVDVRFQGKGCAISVASASLLTEELKGKSLGELAQMNHTTMTDLLGIDLGPVRLKCATLILAAAKRAVGGEDVSS